MRIDRFVFALAITLGLAGRTAVHAADVTAVITADNAYSFGYGSKDGIPSANFFGNVENCDSKDIFLYLKPPYVLHNVSTADYLYIIAWSDRRTSQGVLAQFKSATSTTYTGVGPWEVFATGINVAPRCPTGDLPPALDGSPQSINAQIALANHNAGDPLKTSVGWVGVTTGAHGNVAFGPTNDANSSPFGQVSQIDSKARWMWYRDPKVSGDPFKNATQKEYLIFRLPLSQVPGVDTCFSTLEERALCTTDGSGDFTYSLNLVNHSGKSIYDVFFLAPEDVTAPGRTLSFAPDHLSLASNPLGPNLARQLPDLRLRGAKPGDTITFLVSMQDKSGNSCCAVRKTIQLPDCSCAQVTREQGLSCRSFLPPFTYGYSFDLQNLVSRPAQFVLLAAEPPSTATFTKDAFDLKSGALGLGGTASFNTIIANAQPGSQVCFTISAHDGNLDHCCAIEKCVSVPDCRIKISDFDFDPHRVRVDFTADGGVISGPGKVTVDTGQASGFDAQWLPIDTRGLADGASLRNTFRGTVDGVADQPLVTSTATKQGNSVLLATDFSAIGSTRQRVEYYAGGLLVGTQRGVPNGMPHVCLSCTRAVSDVHYKWVRPVSIEGEFGTPNCLPYSFDSFFDGEFCFTQTFTLGEMHQFGAGFRADEVRVFPEDTKKKVGQLSQVDFQLSGIPSLTLTSANTTLDCNHNGISDDQDVATGASPDVNHDGVPDECGSGTRDLALSLSTGFDQATGTLLSPGALPGGTADDDWAVALGSSTIPAKRVLDPVPAWPQPLPGSAWISVNPRRGLSVPGVRQIPFTTCFCLAADAADVSLDLQVLADDAATVLLNGALLAGPGGRFDGSPLVVQRSGTAGDGLFRAGTNCLTVQVDDGGGFVTGLDLAGSVHSPNGACAASSLESGSR